MHQDTSKIKNSLLFNFKEILAIKQGTKKFNFYFIEHMFLVEMDMS